MKKLLLILFTAGCALNAQASHLMGGEIVATQIPSGKYKLTLSYYRDTIGIPLASSEMVKIYTASAIPGGTYSLLYASVPLRFDTAASTALVPSFPYGVQTGIYTNDSIALLPGKYRIISTTCCRNGAILNASNPLSEELVLYTDLTVPPTGTNSSPRFLAMPIAHFAVNTTTTYNPLPFDPDLDSIAWDYNNSIGSYSFTGTTMPLNTVAGFVPLPSVTAAPFTMNPVTGQITWTPINTGNYIQSFKISEYKAGVLTGTTIRDMQYVVLPFDSTTPPPSFSMITPYHTNAGQQYNYAYYTPGQPYTFQIKGTSSSIANTLNMSSYGEPFGMSTPATFAVSGIGNDITGTFNWTPPTDQKRDVTVIFRVGNGIFTKDFTLVLKKDPITTAIAAVNNTISSFKIYPNPVGQELHLSLEIKEKTEGDISVYSMTGIQVKNLYKGVLNRGVMQLESNLQLPSGNYFVVIKNGAGILATKQLSIQ